MPPSPKITQYRSNFWHDKNDDRIAATNNNRIGPLAINNPGHDEGAINQSSPGHNMCRTRNEGARLTFLSEKCEGRHTERTWIPFPFKLHGIWSRGQFSFRFSEPNGIPVCSKSKGKPSPRPYHIQCERKWNATFLSTKLQYMHDKKWRSEAHISFCAMFWNRFLSSWVFF